MGTRKNRSDNNGEIAGATMALKQASNWNIVEKLRMNTSSKVLYDAVTDSIPKWKEKEWRNESDGRKIRNCCSWKKLDKAMGKLGKDVEYNYIPAEWDNPQQNHADHLAKTGAKRL